MNLSIAITTSSYHKAHAHHGDNAQTIYRAALVCTVHAHRMLSRHVSIKTN